MDTTFIYPNLDMYHFVLNCLGLQNGILEVQWSYNAPSWYISVLLCCYATFYLLVNKSKENDNYLILKYVVTALAGGVTILWGCNVPVFNALMGRGFLCFFIGALLAKLYQRKDILYTNRIGYICLFILSFVWILTEHYGNEVLGNIHMSFVLGIIPMFLICVLFLPWMNKVCCFKPLVYLGKISLSIYLWHFPMQCVWKIIEVYCGIEINYSRRIVWILYTLSVLLFSIVYESFFATKVQRIEKLFVCKTRNE